MNKKVIVAAVAGMALGFTSCKKYLDVNDNPNIAHNGNVQTLLPAAQLHIGSAVGGDLQVKGSIWSQFWTQSPAGKEFIAVDQFNPSQASFSQAWESIYRGAENFYQLDKIATAQYKRQYRAIALLMEAYAFQVAADAWGDVPFTDALQGQYEDGHIVNPDYDSQRVVYRGVLALIDSASDMINTADGNHPGTDDLIYGGNMRKWMRFANTLKLKALTRMAAREPVFVSNEMDSLFSKNPEFLMEGDDARIVYGTAALNNNPLYASLSSTAMMGVQQLAGSATCIDAMAANNDYRGSALYNPVASGGLVGITQSAYDIAQPSGSYSIPSAWVGADAGNSMSATAPVVFMSAAESYFLQAEAIARGWTTGDDAAMFYAGIHASFAANAQGITATTGVTAQSAYDIYVNGDASIPAPPGYWAMYPVGAAADARVRHINTQKWFAMCGSQGFEAWTEWRRTGYPDFLVSPRNSYIGTQFPRRFIYPASEAATNSKYPGLEPITANVWWNSL